MMGKREIQRYVIRKGDMYHRGMTLQGYTDDQTLAKHYDNLTEADDEAKVLRNYGHSVVVEPYFPPPKVV